MSLSVTDCFARLGPRVGPWVGLADLDDAVASGLRRCGVTPASPAAVADADLAGLPAGDLDRFYDCATARALETVLNNLTDDLLRAAGVRATAAEVRPGLERQLARLEAKLRDEYGVGLTAPTIGVIALDFNARADDDPGYGAL
jgi:hypothetical protein